MKKPHFLLASLGYTFNNLTFTSIQIKHERCSVNILLYSKIRSYFLSNKKHLINHIEILDLNAAKQKKLLYILHYNYSS